MKPNPDFKLGDLVEVVFKYFEGSIGVVTRERMNGAQIKIIEGKGDLRKRVGDTVTFGFSYSLKLINSKEIFQRKVDTALEELFNTNS